MLNSRPTIGQFEIPPETITELDPKDLVLENLRHNWLDFSKKIYCGLKSRNDDTESGTIIIFGFERVRLSYSLYVSYYASPSLLKSLFGNHFSQIQPQNIVRRTKRTMIIHLYSATMINNVLTLSCECASKTMKRGYTFQLCGKVDFVDSGSGIEKTGYIINETNTHFQVLCLNGSICNMRRPEYDETAAIYNNRELIVYQYQISNTVYSGHTNDSFIIQITTIYPVRIQLLEFADMNLKILGQYFVTDPHNNINENKITCKFNFVYYIITLTNMLLFYEKNKSYNCNRVDIVILNLLL